MWLTGCCSMNGSPVHRCCLDWGSLGQRENSRLLSRIRLDSHDNTCLFLMSDVHRWVQVWRYEGSKTLAYYLKRRDCIRALAKDLAVPEEAVPATVMKHIFECLTVRAGSYFCAVWFLLLTSTPETRYKSFVQMCLVVSLGLCTVPLDLLLLWHGAHCHERACNAFA